MHARIGSWRGSGEELERWVERSRDEVVPQVRAMHGSCGALLLLDREGGRALTITLWESEEALRASEQRREAIQQGTTRASGARVDTTRYAVVASDLADERETAESNKALVRRFYAAIDEGDSAAMSELVADDYVDHSPPPFPGLARGRKGVEQAFAIFAEATPGIHLIEDQVAEGDKVVTRLTAQGTHERDLPGIPRTGNRLTMTATVIHRIEGGKLAEKWSDKDVLGFLRQLGALPDPEAAPV